MIPCFIAIPCFYVAGRIYKSFVQKKQNEGKGEILKMTELALGQFDKFGGRAEMMLGSVMPDTQFLLPKQFKLIDYKSQQLIKNRSKLLKTQVYEAK